MDKSKINLAVKIEMDAVSKRKKREKNLSNRKMVILVLLLLCVTVIARIVVCVSNEPSGYISIDIQWDGGERKDS